MRWLWAYIFCIIVILFGDALYTVATMEIGDSGPSRTDWITVVLTAALIVVSATQAAIYGLQAKLMKDTLDATKTSAHAAVVAAEATKRNVDAELSRQRPRILAELRNEYMFALRGGEETGGRRSDFTGRLMYRNWGGSTGWVDGLAVAKVVVWLIPQGNTTMPPLPPDPFQGFQCPMAAVDPAKLEVGETVIHSFSVEDWQAVAKKEAEIVVSGAISYQDPVGTRYVSGFCWILESTGMRDSDHSQTFRCRRGPAHYFFDKPVDT